MEKLMASPCIGMARRGHSQSMRVAAVDEQEVGA